MSQTMYLNQFNQTPIKGNSATKVNLNTLPVTIDPNSVNTLLPGDAVYLTTSTSNQIYVDKCAAGVAPFGYILYNMRIDQFKANDRVEIGLAGTILFAESGAAISRGQSLEYVPNAIATGPQMIASAGTNPVSAVALDNAASSGVIFRMMVLWQPELTVQAITNYSGIAGNNTIPSTPNVSGLSSTISITPTASMTLNAASVIPNKELFFVFTTSGTTSYTITFGTNFKSTGTLATGVTSGKVFTVNFIGDGVNYNENSRTVAM